MTVVRTDANAMKEEIKARIQKVTSPTAGRGNDQRMSS